MFLLSRRWILFFVFVAALSTACVFLGRWQFHRLAERKATNAITRTNLHAAPAPVDTVLTDQSPEDDVQWRAVVAHGRYDPAHTLIEKYISHNGNFGVNVVVPLRLTDGSAVMVDRGWVAGPDNGQVKIKPPPVPRGEVTVTGWARLDSSSLSAATPHDGTIRAINATRLRSVLPYRVLGGYVSARHETPAAARTPVRNGGPDLSDGPHFFYGLQWFFFAVLAITGFCWFAWIEYQERLHPELRRGQGARNAPPPRKVRPVP